MRTLARMAWPALVLATACALNTPPVPMEGDAEDVAALTGDWTGEYWSAETGRSGSIWFRLEEGADTAKGDVLMIPHGSPMHDHPGDVHPQTEYIGISFVRVWDEHVRGVLEPYRDPVCGCRLHTSFEGLLRGDTIAGTFTTKHVEGGGVQEGRWRVVRVQP